MSNDTRWSDSAGELIHRAMTDTDDVLAQSGVKGMRWGVRKDERALSDKDKALNISQRSQVKVASSISALASIGMATNAAATLFQLQNRIEHFQAAKALLQAAEQNPFINDAARESIRQAKNNIVKGIVGSALATTAVSIAIGIVTQRTAKAYFAPLHKVYGDSKPKINSEIRALGNDIKSGKRPHMTVKDYNQEVSSIVQKHMTADKKNLVQPFHELARTQLGLNYNTEQLKIKFEKLPNTDLYDKMTIVTPHGLKLVKAIKKVEHSDLYEDSDLVGDIDWFFDYKFDSEGYISEWTCSTLDVAHEILEGRFDMESVNSRFGDSIPYGQLAHSDTENRTLQNFLRHALAVKEVAPTSKKLVSVPDATPRGLGRDTYFDESMIKRDGKGRFSSKAELDQKAGDLKLTDEEAKYLDDLWAKDLSEGDFALAKNEELLKARHATAEKYGYAGTDDELYEKIKANPEASSDLNSNILKGLNDRVGGVSPSGKNLREVYLKESEFGGEYTTRVVPHSGAPSLDINTTWALEDYRGRKARIAQEAADTTPMFNPKADIRGGRVSDLGVNGSTVSNDDMVVINKYINDVLGLLGHSGMPIVDFLKHAASETPWSQFKPADYSIEQWHRACIVHQHEGAPTGKDQCKLPVREPNGTLSKAGVHAAAAALGGARGGVKLSVGEKIAANKMMKGYYSQIGEKPPEPKLPAFLKHAERTIQDILDDRTPEQVELMELVIGAAIENDDITLLPGIEQRFNALPEEMINLVHFVVGNTMAEDTFLHSDDIVGNFLAQSGVKGMRWGVRNAESSARLSGSSANTHDNRRAARGAVQAGSATLGEAHLAALKSTGHRAINAVTGDKTFWKRAAITGGIAAGALALTAAAPAVLPSSALGALGTFAAHALGYNVALGQAVGISSSGALYTATTASMGHILVTAIGTTATSVGAGGAVAVNAGLNLVRAVTGNSQIDKSYASLGKMMGERQVAGNLRTRKILSKAGALSEKDLTHMEQDLVDDFLAQSGIKGMRWGIRRPRNAADGTVDGGAAEKQTKGYGGGSSGAGDGGGSSDRSPKADTNNDGKQDHIAVDATRFANAQVKSFHEMSNQEIKDANARAKAIKEYNDIFTPQSPANSALQQRVNALKLEKDYRQLSQELSPPSKIEKYANNAQKGFAAFKAVDTLMGGQLSSGLTKKLGLVDPPSTLDLLKNERARLDAHRAIVVSKGQLNDAIALGKHLEDPASLAPAYPYAGKRAAGVPLNTRYPGIHKVGVPVAAPKTVQSHRGTPNPFKSLTGPGGKRRK